MKNKPIIRLRVSESGNGYVLYLNKQIMDMYNLKKGSLVDISDMYKVLEDIKKLPNNETRNNNNKLR